MYHDLWSSSFIFLDFPKKIMKYQPVIKCYKHQWENRWSPDISPRSQASSTPTWASPRAPHWSWAPRWARGKRCRPGCTSIPPGAPFGERHRCWRMRPEVEQLRKTWGFLETQQMASLKKWLFFFSDFHVFFLNVLMIFGTFDPIALWNTSRCSSTLLQATFSALAVVFKGSVNLFAGYGNRVGLGSLGLVVYLHGVQDWIRRHLGDPSATGTSSVPGVHWHERGTWGVPHHRNEWRKEFRWFSTRSRCFRAERGLLNLIPNV